MAVRFLVGPAQSGKTQQILNEIADECRTDPLGGNIILLVPEQASYQAEHALLTRTGLTGYSRARVLSFTRLDGLLRAEESEPPLPAISKTHRFLITAMLTRKLREETENPFFNIPGIEESLEQFVGELYSQDLSSQSLRAAAEKITKRPDARRRNNLVRKLDALALFADEFASYVRGRFQDPADSQRHFIERLKVSEHTRGARLYVDNYISFMPVEEKALANLIKVCQDTTICLTCDPELITGSSKSNRRSHVFRPVIETYERLYKLFNNEDISDIGLEERRLEPTVSPIVRAIDFHLLSGRRKQTTTQAPEFLEQNSPRNEVRAVVSRFLDMIEAGTHQPGDFVIFTRDLGSYAEILKTELRRAAIPFYLDEALPMRTHPLVLGLSSLLDAASDERNGNAIVALGKSGLLATDRWAVDLLEMHLQQRPRTTKEWSASEPWKFTKIVNFDDPRDKHDISFQEAEAVDKTRRQLYKVVSAFRRNYLNQQQIDLPRLVEGLKEFLTEHSTEDFRIQEAALYNAIVKILDECAQIAVDAPMERREAIALLKTAFDALTVPRIPPRLGVLQVGQIDRSRVPHTRVVAVIGLNEGVFPRQVANRTLLSDDDRRLLVELDVEVKADSRRIFDRELFHAYRVLTAPRETLILSRSTYGADGSEVKPSLFWNELRTIFGGDSVSIQNHYRERILTKGEEQRLTLQLNRTPADGVTILGRYALDAASESITVKLEQADKLRDITYSATRLETFQQCPFKHFANYFLRPRDFKPEQVDAQMLGLFAHKVLERFCGGLKSADLQSMSDTEVLRTLNTICSETEQSILNSEFMNTNMTQAVLESLRYQLLELGKWIVSSARQLDSKPDQLEQRFTLDFPLAGGGSAKIFGFVDRIDRIGSAATGPRIIIDYKLTRGEFDFSKWAHGLSMQLPIYALGVNAMKEGETAGVYLLRINNSKKGQKSEEPTLLGLSNKDLLPPAIVDLSAKDGQKNRTAMSSADFHRFIEHSKAMIEHAIRRLSSGEASPVPTQHKDLACKYCDYKALCRFDESRHPADVKTPLGKRITFDELLGVFQTGEEA